MKKEYDPSTDPRVTKAASTLQSLIQSRYPKATFTSFRGEDPDGLYLRAAVDLDDPDEVMDVAIEKLLEYQLEQDLPVYLLPVRTDKRIAKAARAQGRPHKTPLTVSPELRQG